jgi:hypothetical protein
MKKISSAHLCGFLLPHFWRRKLIVFFLKNWSSYGREKGLYLYFRSLRTENIGIFLLNPPCITVPLLDKYRTLLLIGNYPVPDSMKAEYGAAPAWAGTTNDDNSNQLPHPL